MKVVNKSKFLRMIIVMIIIMFSIFFICNNKSFSKGEIKEKVIYVSDGDTLWSIAKEEKENNDFYSQKDIREIVYEIKEKNNLDKNSNLSVGQKIVINYL